MKSLAILLLLVAVSHAQPGSKTLLVAGAHTRLDSVVSHLIPGAYDVSSDVPSNISVYHTILIDLQGLSRTALDDRLDLLDFLKSGGQLYLEGAPPDPIVDHDTNRAFWDSIGVHHVGYTMGEFTCDSAYGAGAFTGFSYKEPFNLQRVGYGGPEGDIDPVLYLCGQPNAWVPHNTAYKVILQYYPQGPNYYPSFMQRVLCDYFALCPAEVSRIGASGSDIRVLPGETENVPVIEITAPAMNVASVDLYNVLGVHLQSIAAALEGQTHCSIPVELKTLPPGTYYVRVTFATTEVRSLKLVKR